MDVTWPTCRRRAATSSCGCSISRLTRPARAWWRAIHASSRRICTSMLLQESPGVPSQDVDRERQAAAARLGAERRRLFLAGALLGILAPVLPYLTGAWENAWF